jgi:hypothetical protein
VEGAKTVAKITEVAVPAAVRTDEAKIMKQELFESSSSRSGDSSASAVGALGRMIFMDFQFHRSACEGRRAF